MPERIRVRHELAKQIIGHGIYWRYNEARPDGAQAALDEADARYLSVVNEVNWSRIVQEAFVRCRKSEHSFPEDEYDFAPVPCHHCLHAELLVEHSADRGTFA